MIQIPGKLRFWFVHFNQGLARRREKRYLPIIESDYPMRNRRYIVFENLVGWLFPGFVEPNYLTSLRIVICIALLFLTAELSYLSLLAMTIIGGLSDFFDGAVARAQGKKTKLGVMLDPLADKLLVFSVLYVLTIRGDIKPIYILCMALCETHVLLIPTLSYAYQWKRDGEHRPSPDAGERVQPVSFGRVKLHFYVYAVLLIIIGRMMSLDTVIELGGWFLVMGISAAVIALLQYVYRWAQNPY